MQPFDKDYLSRRETQIQEMYELRAMIWAVLVTGFLLTLVSVGLLVYGSQTLGWILFILSLLFDMAVIFMFADYMAKKGADRAIQQERDQLMAFYGQEKPKRGQDVRLSDDGELVVEDSLEDQIAHRDGQSR